MKGGRERREGEKEGGDWIEECCKTYLTRKTLVIFKSCQSVESNHVANLLPSIGSNTSFPCIVFLCMQLQVLEDAI